MGRKTTWWRNLGGFLAACVLALLVAAPMTSAAACLCPSDAAALTAVVTQVDQAGQRQDGEPCKAACCQGGHCHHAGPGLTTRLATVVALAPTDARHAIAPAEAMASQSSSTLDRPPRG